MKLSQIEWPEAVKAFAAALLVGLPGTYLAGVYHSFMTGKDTETSVVKILFNLAVLFAGAQLARNVVTELLRFRTRKRKHRAQPREVLVIFLSELPKTKRVDGKDVPQDGLPVSLSLKFELAEDLRRLAADKKDRERRDLPPQRWSWEQPLRGIYHNKAKDTLKRLVIVCSRESILQVHMFVENVLAKYRELEQLQIHLLLRHGEDAVLLKSYGDCKPPIQRDAGWDFEDFDGLTKGLDELLQRLNTDWKVADKKISIDLTGGMKPTTVAAALVTINREIQNQYVCTNPIDKNQDPWEYEVSAYDLIVGSQSRLVM